MTKFSLFYIVCLVLVFMLGTHMTAQAQLRKEQRKVGDLSGPIVKQDPSKGANLSNLFNMKMSHSYSMTFSSVGGHYQNLNAYTNSMQFFFSPKLTGELDLSLLHSPFGSSNLYGAGHKSGLNPQFLIRNAELDYQISDQSSIHVQFQQRPGYQRNPWGYGYQEPFQAPFYR